MKLNDNRGRTRSKLAVINMGSGFVYQLINIFSSMVLPPLVIRVFGSSINGLIAAIRQLLGYAQLFGAGISAAAMQALYLPLSQNDKNRVSRMVSGIDKTFSRAGLFFSLAVVLIAGVYPLFIPDQNYLYTVALVLILGVAGASELFYIGKCMTLLEADQRSYVISIVQSLGALANVAVGVILLYATENMIVVQAGCTIAYVIRVIIPAVYIKTRYQYVNPKDPPDLSAIQKRKDSVVHSLMGSLTLNSQMIILSIFVSTVQTSIYSVYNLVFYGLYSVISSLSNSLTASIGSLMVTSTKERVKDFYNVFEFLFFIMLFVIYSTAAMLIYPFIHLYVGNADVNYLDTWIAVLFVANGLLSNLRVPATIMINAAGHFGETKAGAVIETVLSISIQLITIPFLKIYGVLLGTFVALLFRSNNLILYTGKHIVGSGNKRTYLRLLLNLAVFAGIFTSIRALIPYRMDGWGSWIAYALVITLVNLLVISLINILVDRNAFRHALPYLKLKFIGKKAKVGGLYEQSQ